MFYIRGTNRAAGPLGPQGAPWPVGAKDDRGERGPPGSVPRGVAGATGTSGTNY